MTIPIEELNKLMTNTAKDAIDYLKNNHMQSVQIDESALQTVDLILAKLALQHVQEPIDDKHIFTISAIFGAFVGEIFKTSVGGEWFQDNSEEGAPFIVLNYAGKAFPFASVCYEKLVNSPENSIAKYYELAKTGSMN